MTDTTSAIPPAQILKTDVLGRVKTPKARREEILDEFERSGLSGTKFAELTGINYQTFATWAQHRRRTRRQYPQARPPVSDPTRWLEAIVQKTAPTTTRGLLIHLPGQGRMEVSDAAQAVLAAAGLQALAESKPC